MANFATGKYAWGICDITGFRYRLKDMKKTWNGLLVGPDQFDSKHPQLGPTPVPDDPQALQNPRIDTSDDANFFSVYTNVGKGKLGKTLETYEIAVELGSVTITTP